MVCGQARALGRQHLFTLLHPSRYILQQLSRADRLAQDHPGFLWRIPDETIASEIKASGFDNRMSATVSVWKRLEDL
ncbi:DUF3291 domain-containing protein [Aminobacter anthyllidis]